MTKAVEIADTGHTLKAWVNFNGAFDASTENPANQFTTANNGIRAAHNVDYIIDRATGDFEIHFENAMPDVNYVVVGISTSAAGSTARSPVIRGGNTFTTSGCQIEYERLSDGNLVDEEKCLLAFLR